MTNDQAEFLLSQIYLPAIQNEHKTTRRVIAAMPADKCDFKPHANSMGALQLAWHIAASECFFMNGVVAGKFEAGGPIPETIKTPPGVVTWYNGNGATPAAPFSALHSDGVAPML